LTRDFKTPQEMAAPKVEGNVKTWTQTVRATQAQVTQIPPFELPYFDAAKGVYSVARSEPVPIKVRPTEVVTAKDAEGGTEAQPERAPLKAWQEGITHNYEGLDVIEETSSGLATWIRSPAWLALLAGPPAAYGLLLAGVLLARRRNADPAAAESRRALPMLRRDLRRGHDDPPAAAQALKRYLGRKLHVPSGAMTSADACREIEAAGLEATLAREIRDLLERCEAHRYARGAAGAADLDDLRRRVARLARQVERGLR
jgi:hypothetical protein